MDNTEKFYLFHIFSRLLFPHNVGNLHGMTSQMRITLRPSLVHIERGYKKISVIFWRDNIWFLDERRFPGSRIHSTSMHGYPYRSMDIHKSKDTWLIFIKTWVTIHEYLSFTDIHCRMSLHGYPCLDINVDIHTCMDTWRLTSKYHGCPC